MNAEIRANQLGRVKCVWSSAHKFLPCDVKRASVVRVAKWVNMRGANLSFFLSFIRNATISKYSIYATSPRFALLLIVGALPPYSCARQGLRNISRAHVGKHTGIYCLA